MLVLRPVCAYTAELLVGEAGLLLPDVFSIAKLNKTMCFSGFMSVARLIHLCSPNEEQVKNLDLL